jgi:hypothetical protein
VNERLGARKRPVPRSDCSGRSVRRQTLPKLVLPPPDSCEIGKSVGRASMTKCCNSSDRRTCCGARPVTTTCPTARSPADRAASERHRERTGSRRTLSTRSSRATRGRPVASNMARATLRPVQQTSRLVMLVTVLREIQHAVSWSPTRTSCPIWGLCGVRRGLDVWPNTRNAWSCRGRFTLGLQSHQWPRLISMLPRGAHRPLSKIFTGRGRPTAYSIVLGTNASPGDGK